MIDAFLSSKRAIFISLIIALVFIAAGFCLAYFPLRHIRQPIILHFSVLNGIDVTGTVDDLWNILLFSFLLVGMNSLIVRGLMGRNIFLARIVAGLTLFMGILLFAVFLTILNVN